MPKFWALDRQNSSIFKQVEADIDLYGMTLKFENAKTVRTKITKEPDGFKAETILQGLPHAIIVMTKANKITFANFAAEVFFGLSEKVLKKRSFNTVVPFSSPLLSLIEQVKETGGAVNEYDIDLNMMDHPPRTVDVFATPLAEDETSILLMIQQRNMANMIERQLSHRGAARSVSGMAAVLAHEIKNPLSGIRGAAQLLEAGAAEEDRPLAQLITQETDRIRNLVDRMEVFGDERPMKKEPVNIHTVLDHVKQIAQTSFARHISFTQVYDPSLPHVPGNRDKLIQAFLNLVKNSADAIGDKPEGHITLSTAFRSGLRMASKNSEARVGLPLEICVSDNGAGVPDDIKPHLFEPFVTTKTNGSGLGLALVAKIIGDHGGVIECETKTRLTTFRTMLPMHQQLSPTKGAS